MNKIGLVVFFTVFIALLLATALISVELAHRIVPVIRAYLGGF